MTPADLLTLRDLLTIWRRSLVDRLVTDTSGVLELAHVSMLADTHTAIQAVEAELLELEGDEP
jgi:hypothetical protein